MNPKEVCPVFALLACLSAFARADLKSEFRAQYEPEVRKLREFYNAVTMHATLTKTNCANEDNTHPLKLVFYANGDEWRLDTFTPGQTEDVEESNVRVLVAAPQGSFTVTREPGRRSFILNDVLSDRTPAAQRIQSRARFVAAPYGFHDITVLDELSNPASTITSIEPDQRDGESLVRVSYRMDALVDGKPWQYIGWFLFSKERSWALRGYLFRAASVEADQARADIEYGESVNGIPLLKKAEFWMQTGNERSEVHRYDITEIKLGAAATEDFKMAAFGIRNIREEKETRIWPYLIVMGLVFIAAAIITARITARRRASL